MSVLLLVAGAALVLLVLLDAVLTTMTAGTSGGPLSGRLGRGLWRVLLRVGRGPAGPPPVPSLEPLVRAGVPTVEQEAFANAVRPHEARRTRLHGTVQSDARAWPGG